ncbi:MAG: hypothetical protein DMF79_02855 [Acidobacteria bacterium]|nr:MAG: hypothetical protein DMF79_02855 [Acidobacteriota bacterium]
MAPWRASLIVAAVVAAVSGFPQTGSDPGLIVHEWGTFTSVVDEAGRPMEWRPFGRPSDLPGFVYGAHDDGAGAGPGAPTGSIKPWLRALVRLETPVVYFYGRADTDVSARVSFPGGRITEWYPWARPTPSGLAWERVRLLPEGASALPEERDESRYYAARATDAVPLAVEGEDGTQEEKFLFYRGAGRIVPPVLVALRGEDVVVSDYGAPGVAEVVLFENHGGRTSYLVRAKGGGQASLPRDATGGTMESLRTDLEALLVRHGLFAREAAAMLETWGDSWFEEGTRVFYVVPQGITDAALPLSIDPRPTRTVRVLVARTELLTPERLASLAQDVRDLPESELSDPADRAQILERLGRFAEPGLRLLLDSRNLGRLRGRVERLLRTST